MENTYYKLNENKQITSLLAIIRSNYKPYKIQKDKELSLNCVIDRVANYAVRSAVRSIWSDIEYSKGYKIILVNSEQTFVKKLYRKSIDVFFAKYQELDIELKPLDSHSCVSNIAIQNCNK